MGVYYVGILLGSWGLGPVLGGSPVQRWSWRATQWFQMAYGTTIPILILFALRETTTPKVVCRVQRYLGRT